MVSAVGVSLLCLPKVHERGQVIVGMSIGMGMTAVALVTTILLLPALLAGTLFVMVMAMFAALLLMPLARIEHRTAFFVTAAAVMADMATMAQQRGGGPHDLLRMHAIRVATLVAVLPVLVIVFDEPVAVAQAGGYIASLPLLILALGLVWLKALMMRLP